MAVLGVTAIAVDTTTTKTTARSRSTGGTTGGGPSSAGSPPRHVTRATEVSWPTAERWATTTLGTSVMVPPPKVDHIGSVLHRPVQHAEVIVREIPAPAVKAAVPGVGPVATDAVTPVLVTPPVTLRPVPVVETPPTARPLIEQHAAIRSAASTPVAMTPAVFALAVASGLSARPDPVAVASAIQAVAEPAHASRPVPAAAETPSAGPKLRDASTPADPLRMFSTPQLASLRPASAHVPAPAAAPDDTRTAAITGGTAADADADAMRSRMVSAPAVPASGTAGEADARALQARGTVPAGPATEHTERAPLPVPSAFIGSTTAVETAAAAIDSTDAAAAMQLAHALDAAGKGFQSAAWNEDSRSNAAVLRLGAAEAWSRHEKERAELFADLRSATAGLRAQTGFDQLVVRQLIGGA